MAAKMSELHGVDANHVTTLKVAGIENTDDLMKIWSDKEKRAGLVESTGIAEEQFMKFAGMARLSRVKAMGMQFLPILVAAGIDGPKRLFTYTPESLVNHLKETAADKKLADPVPTLEDVKSWYSDHKPGPQATPAPEGVVAK
ncbi:MAG TPA: DUF4332 domain-containing protein [Acidobacteriota bacterium]|nr:DUF4332 domain-containing protein [Acidobacteriota bacterium]